jgi:iron complex transport system substrate-binding protein
MGFTSPFYHLGAGLGGRLSDRNGNQLFGSLEKTPERLVSLIPSMTASLFDLGLDSKLVGVTDYCPQPRAVASSIPTVGGTRDPSLEKIVELEPDLVLVNREENDRRIIEQLIDRGVAVWITFPCSVDEAIEDLWTLINLIPSEALNTTKLLMLERSLEWTRRAMAEYSLRRVFYPIWMDESDGTPWFMTINAETYIHDVLTICGGENIFAARARNYPLMADLGRIEAESPGDRDCRYPRVTVPEVLSLAPEVILLPDEPFAFTGDHLKEMHKIFAETPAAQSDNIHIIDGRLINWHGTMLAQAIAEIPDIMTAA